MADYLHSHEVNARTRGIQQCFKALAPAPKDYALRSAQYESQLEFMQRLAALVPRPRLHLIRFHGVLTPNAKLRLLVVPQAPGARACQRSRSGGRVRANSSSASGSASQVWPTSSISTPRRVSIFIRRAMIACSSACTSSSVGKPASTNYGRSPFLRSAPLAPAAQLGRWGFWPARPCTGLDQQVKCPRSRVACSFVMLEDVDRDVSSFHNDAADNGTTSGRRKSATEAKTRRVFLDLLAMLVCEALGLQGGSPILQIGGNEAENRGERAKSVDERISH